MVLRNVGHMEKVWIIKLQGLVAQTFFKTKFRQVERVENPAELWSMQLNDFLLGKYLTKQWTNVCWILRSLLVRHHKLRQWPPTMEIWRWQNDIMTNHRPARHPFRNVFWILQSQKKTATIGKTRKNSKIKMHSDDGNKKDFVQFTFRRVDHVETN